MKLEDFFLFDPWKRAHYCRRCGCDIHEAMRQQHYDWHHSVDTTATVEVHSNAHTRP